MPYQQDGDCPFEGLHWPKTWPLETKVTAKKFCLLDELQRRDLIQYFYKRESAKTKQRPQPSYEFPLIRFCDYFGRFHGNIRKAVLGSKEYKAYVEERGQPLPPPEMSLCAKLDQPSQVDEASAADAFDRAAILSIPASAAPFGAAAGTKRAAPDPDPDGAGTPGALPGAVTRARNCNVASLNGESPVPPPQSHGQPLLPVITLALRGIDAAAANSRCRRGADEDS